MCGIFGAIGNLPDGVLDRVSASIAHRGPDGEGHFSDGTITLLHRRLRIIDLSENAAQPMFNEDGSIVLVFNGEIYNHRALEEELKRAGHQFRSRSDTEVIIHGYEEWGDDVVRHIHGMFAFGLWDSRRRRLLLGRDRSGKKPLYFTELGGVFRFASEIKAIEASGVTTEMAVDKLPFYLAFGFVPAPYTIHAGIMQLPPASRMVVDDHGAHPSEVFWEPRFGAPGEIPPYDEAARQVHLLMERAVERRLESDVPLGAFLSGGIDSSIMVGLMARLSGQRVRTFTIGFADDPRNDETPYARLVAKAFDAEHTEFILDPSSFELVEELVWLHDGPFGDASAIPTFVVSGLTRQHVTVALSGEGGDELFCGYQRFIASEAAEHLPAFAQNCLKQAAALIPDQFETSFLGQARRVAQAAALPLVERLTRWNSFLPGPAELLRPDVAAELGSAIHAPLAWQYEEFAATHGQTILSRILEHNFRTYLPYVLLKKADRTSMGHGLEVRAPFLDLELIEYAEALPPSYLRRGLQTKRILKHAFRDLLPPAILKRGKMGFGPPLASWLRGRLRAYLFDYLAGQARIYDYLDRSEIVRLLDEHRLGIADHGQRLWTLLTLEIWLRTRARQG